MAGTVRDLARILGETERITVGPMVTNPGTRDWSVLASTFATLNDYLMHDAGKETLDAYGRHVVPALASVRE